MRQYKVGDIVLVKCTSLVIEEDTLGYVYSTYQDFDDPSKCGVMIVTEKGEDLQGFSFKEQQKMLIFIVESPYIFNFISKGNFDLWNQSEIFETVINTLGEEDIYMEYKIAGHYTTWTKRR